MKETLVFYDVIAAGTEKVLHSEPLGLQYIISKIEVNLTGTNYMLRAKILSSDEPDSLIEGDSVLSRYGAQEIISNSFVKIPVFFMVSRKPSYLKVYAQNTDTVDHKIECYIVIDY